MVNGANLQISSTSPQQHSLCYPCPLLPVSYADAAEVLFIDDKPANIKAAESFGFQGLLFCRPNSSALQLQEELGKLGLLEPLGA